ncbi:hypothetical protein SLEP1_g13106 [Rubroshorea leprosula]|uniref:U3 small nucleolar RNA-associated protein 25 n=2 Tax=Rubroshorea leprosula TaxID=152421 RepID=A0AAV5IQ41_9ROSI|nr:hypothetical protein SLEP1_g13106 [Rubroshorea leprosula]
MGKQFATKRGLKRHKTPDRVDSRKHVKKSQHVKEDDTRADSPGESYREESNDDEASEEVIYKEPTVYDKLLMKLGSHNRSVADAYNKRQRQEEGNSDTEEDETEGSESLSVSNEEDGEEETDNESPGLQEPITFEDAETDSDVEAFDTDQDDDISVNGLSTTDDSAGTSSFSKHVGYVLSKGEAEELSNKKWKYTWEVPAFDRSNGKWMGTGECFLKDADMIPNYGLKQKLYKHWLDVYRTCGGNDFNSSRQRWFFSLCNSYRDILHGNKKPFYHKGLEEDSQIMDAYLMHSLNHIFRTRDLVTKNDSKISKYQESAKEEIPPGDGFLDQGFTRPKVLILLPLRSIALRVIKRLIQLIPETSKVCVEHIDRFYEEFGSEGVEDDENKDEQPQNIKSWKPSKPSDHQALFGGNPSDDFMIGVKFTRRSVKLYGDFYSSDIIVASPVALITKIGKTEMNKELDTDYLSSIEVLIIDHADVISMQNWDFLKSVIEQLNHIPSKQHGTNIMRIRQWYLDGYARFYRQSIILGYYLNPDMNALFNHHCSNYEGKVKLASQFKGVLPKVLLQVRQVYERFDADSVADVDDARLEYFTKKVFPKIKDSIQGGIMLFVSSYFEFVRLRNFLKSQNASFCLLGDYTDQRDISRARVWFFEGKRKIMVYTERIHFYRRYKIRGIRNMIIYSLPERKEFYPEIVNMLEESDEATCTVLFSRFDQLRLERIVGSASAKQMVKSEKGVFVFC